MRVHYIAKYQHDKGYERITAIWQDSAQKAKRRTQWAENSHWRLISLKRHKGPKP